jgi:hypothetical protein
VIYGRDATRDRHRRAITKLAEIVERVTLAHGDLVQGRNLQTWFDAMNKLLIADLLIWNCLTAKDAKYRNEQETRFIILGMRSVFDDWRRTLGERKYVESDLPLKVPGNVTEIIVGPHAAAGAEDEVRSFLWQQGYSDGLPITRSSVSV